jgi:ribosome assembly protein SQT1
MASEHTEAIDHEDEEGEEFIDSNDVLEEVPDNEDYPMDEDDEDVEVIEAPVVWEDNSEQHFPNHGASVFVVSAHPTEPLAVSGGEDDLGYIWDITDGEVIVKLTGHTDSVTSAAFSADGEMIATGGMDGKVRVWRRVGKENWKVWEFLTELQGPDEVMVRCIIVVRSYIWSEKGCKVDTMAPQRQRSPRWLE